MAWTKRSYDALYQWVSGEAQRLLAERALKADGLGYIVDQLRAAESLGTWYRITQIAAQAVGPEIVEQSAIEAERELAEVADTL